jgi:hypothetical protein
MVHTGTFTKNDGSERTMRFVKWTDIPTSYKGNPDSLKLKSGVVETVYDVDAKGYRSFNNGTVVGSVSSIRENVTFG